jgi:hypothetical protein
VRIFPHKLLLVDLCKDTVSTGTLVTLNSMHRDIYRYTVAGLVDRVSAAETAVSAGVG